MAISLQLATLVSLLTQSILYGAFSVLLVASTYILHKRRTSRVGLRNPILMAAPIMFILASMHLATDFARVVMAFIQAPDMEAGYDVLNSTSSVVYLLKTSLFMAQTVWVGDGFMIYRLYTVWNGDIRVMAPLYIALMASMAMSINAVHVCATNTGADVFVLRKWAFANFSLTLGVNFSSTTLIALRILWSERRFRRISVQGRNVTSAAMIMIESGAIYSIATIFVLVFFGDMNWIQYVFLDGLVPTVGIVFTMMIVRISLGKSFQTAYETTTHLPNSVHADFGATLPHVLTMPSPVAINVSHETETDSDVDRVKGGGLARLVPNEVLELSPRKHDMYGTA